MFFLFPRFAGEMGLAFIPANDVIDVALTCFSKVYFFSSLRSLLYLFSYVYFFCQNILQLYASILYHSISHFTVIRPL